MFPAIKRARTAISGLRPVNLLEPVEKEEDVKVVLDEKWFQYFKESLSSEVDKILREVR